MQPLERNSHIAQILGAFCSFGCFIFAYLMWRMARSQQPTATNSASSQNAEPLMSGHTALIVFAVVIFVLGIALLVIAIRGEIKLKRRALLPANNKQPDFKPEITPATGIAPSPVRASTTELPHPISGKTLPELRPYVVAVSYKRLQQLNALGFETQNVGKEAAVEISIPDVTLGTSTIQFQGNYQRLTSYESAYWRVLIKHDTGGFSTGNALVNEMRVQGKGEIIVPIHYKNDNNLYYVTWTRFELNASAESRIAVRNDSQELIKWPTVASAQPSEIPFPATAPRPYLEVDDPVDDLHGRTAFVFTNRGGDVAHNIHVAALCIAGLSVVFDLIPIIPVGGEKSTMPKIPGVTELHDVLTLMEREWNHAFLVGGMPEKQEANEWKTAVTVTYEDFLGKRFEATADLICFPIERTLRARHAFEQQARKRKTVEVRNMKFRVIP